jgi:DNA-binding MarR family transcriptional regulator
MTDQRLLDAIDGLALGLVSVTERAIDETVGDLELTLTQWRVLLVIGQSRTPLRVGDVADRIQASLPSTSRILRRLERRTLLSTERDDRDRRATLVHLARAGTTTRRKVINARRRLIAAAIEDHEPMPTGLVPGLEEIVSALAPLS